MLIALSLALALSTVPQDPPAPQTAPETTLSDVVSSRYRAPVGETFLVERAELSPSGERVAYVAALGNSRRLRVQGLADDLVRSADLRGLDIRDVIWAGDDHILLTVLDQPSDQVDADNGIFLVLSYNVQADSWETLLRDENDQANIGGLRASRIPGQPPVLPITFERPAVRRLGVGTRVFLNTITFDGSCRYDLYSIDPATGASELEDRVTQQVQGLVVTNEGRPLAVVKGGRLLMGRGAALVPARATQLSQGVELLGAGRTDGTVLVRVGPQGAGQIMEISGSRGEVATPLPTGDILDALPLYDDQSGRLLGLEGKGSDGAVEYLFFDPDLARVWPTISAAFPGDAVSLASWSTDLQTLLVYAERVDGADYHLVDVATLTSRYLGPSWPDAGAGLDRTGARAEFDIRRAAAARIEDARILCRDLRGNQALVSRGTRARGRAE